MVSAWTNDRVGVRITPNGTFNAMSDSDPEALHAHVAEGLNRFGLAYLHIIEPRMSGYLMIKEDQPPVATQRARKIFKGKIVANGGFVRIPAKANADSEGNANGIPGRRRTFSERSERWHFDCAGSVRLRQEKPVRSAAKEGCC